jgi:hypothetical protein
MLVVQSSFTVIPRQFGKVYYNDSTIIINYILLFSVLLLYYIIGMFQPYILIYINSLLQLISTFGKNLISFSIVTTFEKIHYYQLLLHYMVYSNLLHLCYIITTKVLHYLTVTRSLLLITTVLT